MCRLHLDFVLFIAVYIIRRDIELRNDGIERWMPDE